MAHRPSDPTRDTRGRRRLAVLVVAQVLFAGLIAVSVVIAWQQLTTTADQATEGQQQAERQTDDVAGTLSRFSQQVAAVCDRAPDEAAALGLSCATADQLAEDPAPTVTPKPGLDGAPGQRGLPGLSGAPGVQGVPGPPGPAGPQGAAGRSPLCLALPSMCVGAKGADGANGSSGPPGSPGTSGVPGIPGVDGANGIDGAPGAPGADGAPGAAGAPGVGVAAVAVVDCRLTVTLTDGQQLDAGQVCSGPAIVINPPAPPPTTTAPPTTPAAPTPTGAP